ncbi:putative DNA recombinase [Gottschalkia acidurici 9a]|uniref:DNA recombinase n=1 Tax=Gottschalkia acidurici (strain ATCC 7906 / DSM 604 / BCRC 14475 / CIP 104303 / KCTC 5404 / NCIMB 10678 / 9a) TaxID=1128398 RepID=K0B1F8_GOTA9|nr:recombinase family protein [Gottschalkia acidurici]AFS79833.1 putative DNA recombinase [Gottschalkia acidurici 9a]
MKIAIYSRKSRLTGKGESIQNQIELCKEYANKHFDVDEFLIYEDEGFSGGSSDRPQYQLMIKDAKKNVFNILMCYRLDRISRNISDFSDTIATLQSNNISFISLREQFDTSTPMGRAMMYIASVFAQLERETIAERIKDNMLRLARSGRWLGGNCPTGYTSEPMEYYDDNMNKKTMYMLSQVPKELFIVKKIFSNYLELGSLNQVEVWSIQNNIRTPNNNYFDITSIRGILTNMVYVKSDKKIYDYCKKSDMDIASDISEFDGVHGLMVYNKNLIRKGKANKLRPTSEWIVAVGKHKGIISSDDFIKVQNKLKKNKHKAPKKISNNIALLSSLLTCHSCNSKLRTTYGNKRKDGTRPHYYKCIFKEKSKGDGCNIKNLNGSKTDSLILNEVKKISVNYNSYYSYLKSQRNDILFLNSLYKDNSSSIEKEIDKYKSMIRKLTITLSETTDSSSSKHIINQIEDLDKKIVKATNDLKVLNSKSSFSPSDTSSIQFLETLIDDFNSAIDSLSFSEQKHLLSSIISKILWNGENLEVHL